MCLPQRLARFTKERLPCVGQAADPVAAPLDQDHTQIFFQPSYRHRQRRLRHTEAMRGAVEMTFLRNSDELLHLAQVDHASRGLCRI